MGAGDLPTSQLRKIPEIIANEEHDDELRAKRVYWVRSFPENIDAQNPTTTLSFNAADQLLKIEKTVGGKTYIMTVTDSSVSDTTVSRTLVFGAWT